MNNALTTHRHYPKPHVDNHLQEDVKSLEQALDKIDTDMYHKADCHRMVIDLTAYPTDYFFPVWFKNDPTTSAINRLHVFRLDQADAAADPFQDGSAQVAGLNLELTLQGVAVAQADMNIGYLSQRHRSTLRALASKLQSQVSVVSQADDTVLPLPSGLTDGEIAPCTAWSGMYLRGGLTYQMTAAEAIQWDHYQASAEGEGTDITYPAVMLAETITATEGVRWMVQPYRETDPLLGTDDAERSPLPSAAKDAEGVWSWEMGQPTQAALQVRTEPSGQVTLATLKTQNADGTPRSPAEQRVDVMQMDAETATADFKVVPTVAQQPVALQQEVQQLQQRLDDANDVYELIKATTQVMRSGGSFTPTTASPLPAVDTIEVDTQWLLHFDAVNGSFAFTEGDLAGKTAHNGDILFYNTPSNTFLLIPSAPAQLFNDAIQAVKTELTTFKQQFDGADQVVIVNNEATAKSESAKPENSNKVYMVVP